MAIRYPLKGGPCQVLTGLSRAIFARDYCATKLVSSGDISRHYWPPVHERRHRLPTFVQLDSTTRGLLKFASYSNGLLFFLLIFVRAYWSSFALSYPNCKHVFPCSYLVSECLMGTTSSSIKPMVSQCPQTHGFNSSRALSTKEIHVPQA